MKEVCYKFFNKIAQSSVLLLLCASVFPFEPDLSDASKLNVNTENMIISSLTRDYIHGGSIAELLPENAWKQTSQELASITEHDSRYVSTAYPEGHASFLKEEMVGNKHYSYYRLPVGIKVNTSENMAIKNVDAIIKLTNGSNPHHEVIENIDFNDDSATTFAVTHTVKSL